MVFRELWISRVVEVPPLLNRNTIYACPDNWHFRLHWQGSATPALVTTPIARRHHAGTFTTPYTKPAREAMALSFRQ